MKNYIIGFIIGVVITTFTIICEILGKLQNENIFINFAWFNYLVYFRNSIFINC